MKEILIEATNSTPAISFDLNGRLLIKGRSLPNNVKAFYKPLIEWCIDLNAESVVLNVYIEYFNSASIKMLLELFRRLDANNKIKSLMVNWHYEEGDDSVLETGQLFEELLMRVPFRYHEYAETS